MESDRCPAIAAADGLVRDMAWLALPRHLASILALLSLCLGCAAYNARAAREFLAENARRPEVLVSETGLQYEVLGPGDGCRPEPGSTVVIHYETRVLGRKKPIDSSYIRNRPGTYPLDQMIAGWSEGIPLMREGAKWRFYVPPELAYGERYQRRIGSNRLMIFDVELIEAKTCRRDTA